MSVEKGQKYRGKYSGTVYEVVTDVFTVGDTDYVVTFNGFRVYIKLVASLLNADSYALIIEPKCKVGDRVVRYGATYEVVAVSQKPDKDGDFGYLTLGPEGYFESFDDSCDFKAAE